MSLQGATDAQTSWQPADWADWLDAVDEPGMMPANQTDLELSQRTLTQYGIATSEELGSRFSARTLYHDTLDSMDGTALPTFVERLMGDWSFEGAVGSWVPPAGSPSEGPDSSDPSPTEPASTDPTGTDA